MPLSLPSPRAFAPSLLEVSRADIVFPRPYETPTERLRKFNAVGRIPLAFLLFLTSVGRLVRSGVNDKNTCCSFHFSYPPPVRICRAYWSWQKKSIYNHKRKQDNQDSLKPAPHFIIKGAASSDVPPGHVEILKHHHAKNIWFVFIPCATTPQTNPNRLYNLVPGTNKRNNTKHNQQTSIDRATDPHNDSTKDQSTLQLPLYTIQASRWIPNKPLFSFDFHVDEGTNQTITRPSDATL